MSHKQDIGLLAGVPLFSNLEKSKLQLIAFTSHRLHFRAGQTIFDEGDVTDSIYLIISGEAEVRVKKAEVNQTKVATIGKNSIFGEIGVMCNLPRMETIVAKTEMEALKIDKRLVLQLLQDFPKMALAIMNEIGLIYYVPDNQDVRQ